MRMSDWSSDVCSSDLAEPPPHWDHTQRDHTQRDHTRLAPCQRIVDVMTKAPITILLASPRGFCAGVDRAIQIVEVALERYGAPVYVQIGRETGRDSVGQDV